MHYMFNVPGILPKHNVSLLLQEISAIGSPWRVMGVALWLALVVVGCGAQHVTMTFSGSGLLALMSGGDALIGAGCLVMVWRFSWS